MIFYLQCENGLGVTVHAFQILFQIDIYSVGFCQCSNRADHLRTLAIKGYESVSVCMLYMVHFPL